MSYVNPHSPSLSAVWANRNVKWGNDLGLLHQAPSSDPICALDSSESDPVGPFQNHILVKSYVDSGVARSVCPVDFFPLNLRPARLKRPETVAGSELLRENWCRIKGNEW